MQSNTQIQRQAQVQTLKILPQQIQFLNLLHLNQHELEQFIQKELDENPFLENTVQGEPLTTDQPATGEEGDDFGDFDEIQDRVDYDDPANWGNMDDEVPDYATSMEQGYEDDPWQAPAVQGVTVREDIKDQVRFMDLPDRQKMLVEYLIDSLDDFGFLSVPLDTIADDISFSLNQFVEEEELEAALSVLQGFEPVGIGARNLQECLLIQLAQLAAREVDIDLPKQLVLHHMDALAARQYDTVKRALDIDSEDLQAALELIVSLNPRPLRGFSDTVAPTTDTIQPDYVVEPDGDDLIVSLANMSGGTVRIQADASATLGKTTDKKAQQFISKKLHDAQWLVEALQQRDDTMLRTMRTLVVLQKDYFTSGGDTKKLKPMTLKDIAAYTDLDPSTISRVTSTKYVQTAFGVILVKDLFTQTFTSKDGRELSNTDVMDCLKKLVDEENKQQPLNDTELCSALEAQGFPVARRTVAKYRDLLNIPAADQRKSLL